MKLKRKTLCGSLLVGWVLTGCAQQARIERLEPLVEAGTVRFQLAVAAGADVKVLEWRTGGYGVLVVDGPLSVSWTTPAVVADTQMQISCKYLVDGVKREATATFMIRNTVETLRSILLAAPAEIDEGATLRIVPTAVYDTDRQANPLIEADVIRVNGEDVPKPTPAPETH